ncbi:MAG: type II toxin-antitoxin system RelE/ParE family toxin [Gammaproteobacteria bacterium]|nr:type II toxin-antitoxin system RelE/ParE family toxin [Gammaproteobacteria bacterium]
MKAVVWSQQARRANAEIIKYISTVGDERSARRVHQRILDAGNQLGRLATGRPGRVTGTYEKSVAQTSHIILYALPSRSGREFVLILDIVHMSRNWPRGQMPS